ncbi:MAG: hypothetical protein ABFS56_12990 [Pseudomonadota bacterium]
MTLDVQEFKGKLGFFGVQDLSWTFSKRRVNAIKPVEYEDSWIND